MRVTCCILCYNYGRYLRGAIESCIRQEDVSFSYDILVLDDGSTDDTPIVCAQYACEPRVRVSRTENLGFGKTLTRAFSEAKGEYVCLLDADDEFEPNKLSSLAPFLDQRYLFLENRKKVLNERGEVLADSIHTGSGCTSTITVHRQSAQSLLPIANELGLHPLRRIGPSKAISEQLTRYRIHSGSMLGSTPAGDWYQHLGEVSDRIVRHLETLLQSPPPWATRSQLREAIAYFRSSAAFDFMESALQRGLFFESRWRAFDYFWKAVCGEGISRVAMKNVMRALIGRRLPFDRN